ncbi:putative glutathione transferase [Helianthus annuus]|uniref:Glutathione transferase n=1 Tax=Helianthus annuus TaxID=4232 RepID=A0A9K3EP78_HELAN|nr:putative glutathione transferase [Helianthus annuus]
MPHEASYASLLGNRVFTNFSHSDDSIPTPFTQTPINLSPTSIDLSQNETVPETQPPNHGPSASKPIKKRSHKKKTEEDKVVETAKRKQQKWVYAEEVALARTWCEQSQHSTLGNSQHRTALWESVSRLFHEEMGKGTYRENDSLSSKWSEISSQLTKFSGFLNKAKQNPKSGETEADVLTNAVNAFKSNMNIDFRFMHCWDIGKSIQSGRLSPLVAKLTRLVKGQGPRPKPNMMHEIKSLRTFWMIRQAQTGLSMEEMPQEGVLKNLDLIRYRLQLGVVARVGEYTAISWMTFHASWIHSMYSNNKGPKYEGAKKLEMH